MGGRAQQHVFIRRLAAPAQAKAGHRAPAGTLLANAAYLDKISHRLLVATYLRSTVCRISFFPARTLFPVGDTLFIDRGDLADLRVGRGQQLAHFQALAQ